MTFDQHRGLIGNDLGVIIFYEGTSPFNLNIINGFSSVSQFFIIVQPILRPGFSTQYR